MINIIINLKHKGGLKISFHRPAPLYFIVVILLLLAIGSLFAITPILALVQNPYSLPLEIGCADGQCAVFSPFYRLIIPFNPTWEPQWSSLVIAMILPFKYLIVQSLSPLFQIPFIFYPSLSLLLVVIAIGILMMKNWARILAIISSVLIWIQPVFIHMLQLPVSDFYEYAFFNINILMALSIFPARGSPELIALAYIINIAWVVPLLIFLSGASKYKYKFG